MNNNNIIVVVMRGFKFSFMFEVTTGQINLTSTTIGRKEKLLQQRESHDDDDHDEHGYI